MSFIPLPYKILAAVAMFIGAFWWGYSKGNDAGEAAINNFAKIKNEQIAKLKDENMAINDRINSGYYTRTQIIREKETHYVEQAANSVPAQFDLSNGWLSLHDSAARNADADAALSSDATSSGIKDNSALATVVSNYSICHANAEQLNSLQAWIRENQEAVNRINAENAKKKKGK